MWYLVSREALEEEVERRVVVVVVVAAAVLDKVIRSSLRHASIYQWVLKDDNCEQLVYPFLDEYVHDPNFDVSSDALETVRVMLTGLTSPSGGGGGQQ